MPGSTTGIMVVVALLGLAAYLAAIETVVLRLDLVRAMRLAEEGERGANPLVWLVEHRARTLSVILLLTVVVRVASAVLIFGLLDAVWSTGMAAGVTIAALSLVSFSLTEVAPRSLTLRRLESTGLAFAPLMAGVARFLDLPTRLLVTAGRMLGYSRKDVSGPFAPEDELRELLNAEDDDEHLEDDERAMIHSIFALGETIAREIMTPRPDMVVVDASATLAGVVDVVISHGYSRIPVHRDNRDELIGTVYAKDVLERIAREHDREDWNDLIREVQYVPETKRGDELLRELQEQKVHLAIVVDEYGAMTGLVTIEDILEEIVGEIVDEHDQEEPLVEFIDDDTWRLDARMSVDSLNELLATELPDEGWDSVGGLVLGILGRVPEAGEEVALDGITFVTERVQGRRISKVRVERRPVPEPTPADA